MNPLLLLDALTKQFTKLLHASVCAVSYTPHNKLEKLNLDYARAWKPSLWYDIDSSYHMDVERATSPTVHKDGNYVFHHRVMGWVIWTFVIWLYGLIHITSYNKDH